HVRTSEAARPVNDCLLLVDELNVRAHALELGYVAQSVVEDPLVDPALPVSLRHENGEWRLQISRKAGKGQGLYVGRLQRSITTNHHLMLAPPDFATCLTNLMRQRKHIWLGNTLQNNLASRDNSSNCEGTSFEPVRE